MKGTGLKAGDVVHGFEIRDVAEYDELKAAGGGAADVAGAACSALGIFARHVKSGAEVFHVLNGDEENLFAFAFGTAVNNSTGVAHIVEHTVLCGSERYPLKDAFLVLCQGSLQTYLNAWTFPDKTVYPASSVNEADYFNLMAVYADAVFCPRLDEWAFMQEGHRLEYAENGRLVSNGVVYNEMKGAYSSLDEYADHWSVKSVLPDTPYAFDSGGDPACIPDLTYQAFREFHRERYSPANCKVFLAGNIPTEKQLKFLDEQYFSRLPTGASGGAFPPVARAAPWKERRAFTVRSPAGSNEKATVFLSWLCPSRDGNDGNDDNDAVETLALQVLSEILMGHDGSPLSRALVESGLGEDLASCSGIEVELRETVFSAGLRGVSKRSALSENEKDNAVAVLIKQELQRLATDGIAAEDLEAALLSFEFSIREIRRAHGPYALVWLRRALRAWMRGGHPTESLLIMPRWNELQKRIAANPRYFEALIEKVLLNNPHEALVVVKPDKAFVAKREKEAARKLDVLGKSLTDEERQAIRDKTAAMEAKQNMPDASELLAKIPHLSVKDLSRSIDRDRVPRELHDAGGIPVLAHPLFTNGISYLDFAFPLDVLAPEDYPWLPLFSRVVTSIGVPGKDYGAMASLLACTLGDMHTVLRSGGMVEGTTGAVETPSGRLDVAGRDWLIFRVKMLDEKIAPSLDLLLSLVKDANFNDTRRLRDLILELKNEADSSLAPAGHNYAASRTGMYLSRGRLVAELWHGIAQIQFVHTLLDRDIGEIKRKLIAIRESLLAKSGLLVNITGENIPAARKAVRDRFAPFGPVQRRGERAARVEAFYPLFDVAGRALFTPHAGTAGTKIEVFASPSMQTGFAAASFPALPFNAEGHAAEQVLCHRLSTGALWEELRMKGGAYGAFAQADAVEKVFSLCTYRDPAPSQSLAAFPQILEHEAGQVLDRDTVDKMIIGTYAKIKQPKTSAEKGVSDLFRFFSNVDDDMREKNLGRVLDTEAGDLAAAAQAAGKRFPAGAAAVIAGEREAAHVADALGVALTRLPV
ncbi:MAG: insulinase family protein [Spirochaetaceae bacterium]|nr:insulinase family protein [Spirochaetaceae bacterium]